MKAMIRKDNGLRKPILDLILKYLVFNICAVVGNINAALKPLKAFLLLKNKSQRKILKLNKKGSNFAQNQL